MSPMPDKLLTLRDLRAGYGDSIVLDGVSLDLPEGGSLAVLGRNGVGKTTLLASIMGCTTIRSGAILWRGRDLARLAPYRRARLGIGWAAQEREIFPSLTVEENLTVAARRGHLQDRPRDPPSGGVTTRWTLPAVYRLFPRLAERRRNMGTHLSGGEQQMLAIARALMTNPLLLLLDEPLEGLAPIIVEELSAAIADMIAQHGTAVILVEQHAEVALSMTRDVVVIERGVVAYTGRSNALRQDQPALDRLVGLDLPTPTA
jgi:branched-chain amino acid transport system ATP-binding protein